jgi:hypothetical protein
LGRRGYGMVIYITSGEEEILKYSNIPIFQRSPEKNPKRIQDRHDVCPSLELCKWLGFYTLF